MKKCLKCGDDFIPQKGLINYCSLKCRNSKAQSEEANNKRRQTLWQKIEEVEKVLSYFKI